MSQKVAVGVVFVAAMFMSIMDVTIVNVALPTIGREFAVGPPRWTRISIAFLVSLAVFIPASGWLGDRFGGKRVLLDRHRGVHRRLGAVRAGLQPRRAGRLPGPAGRGRRHARPGRDGDAVPGVPARGADPGLGHPHHPHHVRSGPRPGAGGLLVTDLSWRWVFYVNVPIGVAAFTFGALFLEQSAQARRAASTWPASCCPGWASGC